MNVSARVLAKKMLDDATAKFIELNGLPLIEGIVDTDEDQAIIHPRDWLTHEGRRDFLADARRMCTDKNANFIAFVGFSVLVHMGSGIRHALGVYVETREDASCSIQLFTRTEQGDIILGHREDDASLPLFGITERLITYQGQTH